MSEYEVKQHDVSVQSDLQARREERRRKILENSKLRFEKLNGRISKETPENKPLNNSHRTFSDPEMETEENIIRNKPYFSNPTFGQHEAFNEFKQDDIFMKNSQFTEQPKQQDKVQSILTKILQSKFHLIALSTFTYGFVVYGDKYFSNYSIFLPLLIWELTETIIIRPQENKSQALLNIILLMVGVPFNKWEPILKVTHILNKVFKDVGVFVFSFVICHVIYLQFVTEDSEHKLNKVDDFIDI